MKRNPVLRIEIDQARQTSALGLVHVGRLGRRDLIGQLVFIGETVHTDREGNHRRRRAIGTDSDQIEGQLVIAGLTGKSDAVHDEHEVARGVGGRVEAGVLVKLEKHRIVDQVAREIDLHHLK